MKVFAILIGDEIVPSVRHRVLGLIPGLAEHGVEVRTFVAGRPPRGVVGRASHLAWFAGRVRWSDLVLVHRVLLSPKERGILQWIGRPVVFDFDDAIHLEPPPMNDAKRARIRERRPHFEATLREATCVVAGNAYLAEVAREYQDDVTVIPTTVDMDRYLSCADDAGREDWFTIGWIGSSATHYYLAPLEAPLREVASRVPGAVLCQISDESLPMDGVPIETRTWSIEREVSDLSRLDAGVMWLEDTEYM